MAETFKAKLEIDAGSSEASIRGVNGEMRQLNEQSQSTGASLQTMSSVVTAGVLAYQQISGAISSAVDSLKAMAAEVERQAGIFDRFGGDIDAARARTNGLISDLDLMAVSNRAAASGLQLTGDQLADIAVAATETSAAVGGDATSAMNNLIGAVAEGRTGALRRVGVDLEGISDQAGKQASALAQLQARWRDTSSSADTLGGRLQVLDTEWENQKTLLIETLNANDSMTESYDRASNALATMSDQLSGVNEAGLTWTERTAAAITGTFNAISNAIVTASANVRKFSDAMRLLRGGNFADAVAQLRDIQSVVQDVPHIISLATDEVIANRGNLTNRVGLAAPAKKTTRTNRGGGRSASSAEPSLEQLAAGASGGGDVIGELAGGPDLVALAAREADEKARIGENNATIARQDAARLRDAQRLEDIMKRQTGALREQEAQQAQMNARLEEAGGIGQQVFGIVNAGIGAAISGQESFGTALKQSLKTWLKNFALKQVLEGGKNIAEGLSVVISNPPVAASKFISAAEHFAIAAAAGVGSAAIPGGGGGAGAQQAARPTSGAGGGGGGGGGSGTVVINYNSPVAEADIGRQQARARRSAQNRFAA